MEIMASREPNRSTAWRGQPELVAAVLTDMNGKQKRYNYAVLVGALLGVHATATTVRADGTNSALIAE